MPCYFNDRFIFMHSFAIIFVLHEHGGIFFSKHPTAFNNGFSQEVVTPVRKAFVAPGIATVVSIGDKAYIAAEVIKCFKTENVLKFKQDNSSVYFANSRNSQNQLHQRPERRLPVHLSNGAGAFQQELSFMK